MTMTSMAKMANSFTEYQKKKKKMEKYRKKKINDMRKRYLINQSLMMLQLTKKKDDPIKPEITGKIEEIKTNPKPVLKPIVTRPADRFLTKK